MRAALHRVVDKQAKWVWGGVKRWCSADGVAASWRRPIFSTPLASLSGFGTGNGSLLQYSICAIVGAVIGV